MPYTAAPLLDAILGESYDLRQAARYRPVAAYWNGWSHPRADYPAAPAASLHRQRQRGWLFAAAVLAAPILALARLTGV